MYKRNNYCFIYEGLFLFWRPSNNRRKMSENGVKPVVIDDNDVEDLEKKELEMKRKARDPPIVFPNTINVS